MMKIKKAVIPVAGFGTRFLPISKAVPKELLPIIDKPVIQYIVEEAAKVGIREFIFVISPEKEIIKKYFAKNTRLEKKLKEINKIHELEEIKKISKDLKFSYAVQEKPLGTGHALMCARDFIKNETFAYFDGDAIFDSSKPVIGQVIDIFNKYHADGAVGGMKVERSVVARYGNLDVEKLGKREYKLKRIIEKPTISEAPINNLVVCGQRYVFTPKIFDYLETQKPGVGGEIWLADAADNLAREGNFYACEINGKWFDTGNKLEYLKTVVEFALKRDDIGPDFKKYLKKLDL